MQTIAMQHQRKAAQAAAMVWSMQGWHPYQPAAVGHKKPRTRRGAVLMGHVHHFVSVCLLMP